MDVVNKDASKLICTHLRLVFAADVNILNKIISMEKHWSFFSF